MAESDKPLVLIVEDQPSWRELLVDLLKEKNEYQITTADSYAKALDAMYLQESPFHVVITDIRLDNDDPTNVQGLEILAKLDRHYTKSIVVTGYATIPTVKRAFRDLDVFEYVEKVPADGRFDPLMFRQIVRAAVSAALQQRSTLVVRRDHRLLVVDDDHHQGAKLAAILRGDQYQADACDGIDALRQFLRTHSYSLIILNVSFATDDPSLFYKIREFQPNVQIVLTAAPPQVAVALEAVQEGKVYGVVLIDIPFDEQRFRLLIQRVLLVKNPMRTIIPS